MAENKGRKTTEILGNGNSGRKHCLLLVSSFLLNPLIRVM